MRHLHFIVALRRLVLATLLLVPVLFTSSTQAVGIGDFIVGGQVVGSNDKYPFMVSIQLDPFGSDNFSHACGGSLIAERWVLTAAHCVTSPLFGYVYGPESIGISIGSNNLNSSDATFITAERVISHPSYDPELVRNDIALIELSYPYPAPLAVLPAPGSPVPQVNESSVVVGWGAIVEGGFGTNRLREVALPVISNAACFPFYPQRFDSRLAHCAGGSRVGGQVSWSGDSGGPLLVTRDNVYVVAGIISFGEGCARSGIPGVYTRVEAYTEWITSITNGTLEYGGQLAGLPVDDTVITRIDINSSTSDSLLAGEVAYYDVTGAIRVNLTSESGDADLFIIDDANFQEISIELLKCSSNNASPLDACSVDQSADGAFAVVFGYSDSQYTISTQSIDSGNSTVRPFSTASTTGSSGGSSGGGAVLYLLALLGIPALRNASARLLQRTIH